MGESNSENRRMEKERGRCVDEGGGLGEQGGQGNPVEALSEGGKGFEETSGEREARGGF